MANEVCKQLRVLSLHGDQQHKDPTTFARKYQIELCKKALEENVIVYLGTGCGKTHIAVLLIYAMGHLFKRPQRNVCIFLAPTVALVQQQAKVIDESIDFNVGIHCGSLTGMRNHQDWEKGIEENEVLVMTPQLLLHYLSHCFIRMEQIALLIFDECHYAQKDSNHPYAEIMKVFYKADLVNMPRIFGMTASPIIGKGGSIGGVEALLRAKVYSVEDKDELEQFVTPPEVKSYYYESIEKGYSSYFMIYTRKLEEILNQCMLTLQTNNPDQSSARSTKKLLQKWHCNIIFCLENLGLRGALQACYISRTGDHYETTEEAEESFSGDYLCKKYLHCAALALASDISDGLEADFSCVEDLKEPLYSRKLLLLIGILSSFRLQPNRKCIIFVNRIVTARSLSYIIQNLLFLSLWKCDFLVGVHSGLMSRKNTNTILEKFRSGELNLLVATKVGEEGLDIPTCCLVIRFDLPETVASFIQSRGRARMLQSEYAFLVNKDNPSDVKLIEQFQINEAQMNQELSTRNSSAPMTDFNESLHYRVDATGATISSVASVPLLYHYCSKLPHDEYFNPKPQFFFYDEEDGSVCKIVLAANAPIHQIFSTPQPSIEAAKRDACLKACQALHEVGALTDFLLPEQDNTYEESTQDLSDSDNVIDDESREELHEMLVPSALRKPWTEVENSTCLSSYYIEFNPIPADRTYKGFGLFVKEPLPEEAGKMKLDLSLARGRMVMTQLTPFGVARFDKDEIASAEKFQKMFLKIVLKRHEFIPDYVSIEDDDVLGCQSSTFYLLLPIVVHECEKITVDWTLVKRCLSSPIFRHPRVCTGDDVSQLNNYLHLANGCSSLHDVVNSLVYVPCKDSFYFISDILPEKNGYSSYNRSTNHVENYAVFDVDLAYPDQPLLKAKQLFVLDNLLRKKKQTGKWREKEEQFVELPPEICQLKVIGFSKDVGSSLSLLPSIMHRLENLLVALELKDKLIASFPEGAEVTSGRILEAITTERCSEHFSLERLEVLGDAFLKFAVGRHLFLKHDALDEGKLTRRRSSIVKNSNLLKLSTRNNLQVYIRDQPFEPDQFFAFGHPCTVSCNEEIEKSTHLRCYDNKNAVNVKVRCNKGHHWLHKKTIADFAEALIGAFIVDSGFKAAIAFLNWFGIEIDFPSSQIHDIFSASKRHLPLADQIDVNAVENRLGYKFTHKGLLIQAFVHPSFNDHLGGCYQRLEYLGDAVLDYLITSYLYTLYPNMKPGHLTQLRSVSVNNISFADVAARCSFHKFIICDSQDLRDSMARYVNDIGKSKPVNGHIEERTCPKALGDLVESCMGAVYLDSGCDLSCVWKIMLSLLDPCVSFSKNMRLNPLMELTELCQFYNWVLRIYPTKRYDKLSVQVSVDGEKVSASASATNTSGKTAKRIAARQVFECLKAQGYKSKSKSLQDVLKESEKREAKLIGWDETLVRETSSSGLMESARRNEHDADPRGKVASGAPSAKGRLYEICAANHWKAPVFNCCQETGPGHSREFVYKINMEIDERPNETFEFYGDLRMKKKEAAEHAAQGALWYLKHEGYII